MYSHCRKSLPAWATQLIANNLCNSEMLNFSLKNGGLKFGLKMEVSVSRARKANMIMIINYT